MYEEKKYEWMNVSNCTFSTQTVKDFKKFLSSNKKGLYCLSLLCVSFVKVSCTCAYTLKTDIRQTPRCIEKYVYVKLFLIVFFEYYWKK